MLMCHHGVAFMQFLESYKSVTLSSMATAFGVSVDFIDQELVDFIVAGRLPAKIDKVQIFPYLAYVRARIRSLLALQPAGFRLTCHGCKKGNERVGAGSGQLSI